jgi:hypothetical protein
MLSPLGERDRVDLMSEGGEIPQIVDVRCGRGSYKNVPPNN